VAGDTFKVTAAGCASAAAGRELSPVAVRAQCAALASLARLALTATSAGFGGRSAGLTQFLCKRRAER